MLKTVTVKKPGGKEFETQYGVKKMMIVVAKDGTEEKIYYSPGQQPHDSLARNDVATLIYENKNGKNIRRLVANEETPLPPKQENKVFYAGEDLMQEFHREKDKQDYDQEASKWATQEAKNLAALITIVNTQMQEEGYTLSMEELRNLAVSINIGLGRKYANKQPVIMTPEDALRKVHDPVVVVVDEDVNPVFQDSPDDEEDEDDTPF